MVESEKMKVLSTVCRAYLTRLFSLWSFVCCLLFFPGVVISMCVRI